MLTSGLPMSSWARMQPQFRHIAVLLGLVRPAVWGRSHAPPGLCASYVHPRQRSPRPTSQSHGKCVASPVAHGFATIRGTIDRVTAPPGDLPTPTAARTHACVRCGRPVPLDVGLCELCNPLGLKDVAASQVHGTVIIAVLLAFVGLAVIARLALSGVGPFPATVDSAIPTGDGLAVTVSVTNEGSSAGQTTCRVSDPSTRVGGESAFLLSPRIEPGQTITFTKTVTVLGTEAVALDVSCRAP